MTTHRDANIRLSRRKNFITSLQNLVDDDVTISKVAEMAGISRQTIYKIIKNREITPSKLVVRAMTAAEKGYFDMDEEKKEQFRRKKSAAMVDIV